MKWNEKNEKEESADNALFVNRGRNFNRERHRAGGSSNGISGGHGSHFPNFNSIKGSCNERQKQKGVTSFKCNQDGHIVKNCPYNNKQNSQRESSNVAELEGVALIVTIHGKTGKKVNARAR